MLDKVTELGVAINGQELAELKAIFHDESLDPFVGLGNEYRQEKFVSYIFCYSKRLFNYLPVNRYQLSVS